MPERLEPRISLNKMVEYLEAPAGRRRTILLDQKFPNEGAAAYYRDAYPAIIECLTNDFEPQSLLKQIAYLRATQPANAYHSTRLDSSILALQAFKKLLPILKTQLDGLTLIAESQFQQTGVRIAGVSISVRPDFKVFAENLDGTASSGALKLYLGKNHGLTIYTGECAALIASIHQNSGGLLAHDPKLVFVVDVFGGQIYKVPRASKKKIEDITACCAEIGQVWTGSKKTRVRSSSNKY